MYRLTWVWRMWMMARYLILILLVMTGEPGTARAVPGGDPRVADTMRMNRNTISR